MGHVFGMSDMEGRIVFVTVNAKTFAPILVEYGSEIWSISVIKYDEGRRRIVSEVFRKCLRQMDRAAFACSTKDNFHRTIHVNNVIADPTTSIKIAGVAVNGGA